MKIATIKDIIEKVPAESLDQFLKELGAFCEVFRILSELTQSLSNDNVEIETPEFMEWIDDGKSNISIKIKTD